MNNKEDIYLKVVSIFEELFEIEAQKITLEADLYQDLDIDSIDAIDLVVELKNITGKKMQPEEFRSVRTVQDVVDQVYKLLNDG
ncbi:MAG: acyl carrier protein [Gammaproteobacteria bacterium]